MLRSGEAAARLSIGICGLLLSLGSGAACQEAQGRTLDWGTDLAAARKEAATTGRPLLVVFR